MRQAWWRKWHRWAGFVAAVFLLFVSITGVILAMTEFFGEEEARREATRDLVSEVRTTSMEDAWAAPLARVMATAAREAPDAPIDRIVMQLKGDPLTIDVFLGKPTGGEDKRLIFDARTGALLRQDTYADKPFLNRLHSGEAFGDGGLVVAMFWGAALAFLSGSGLVIYFAMRRRNPVGLQKVFW
ncbi:MAG: PepSY-associated TM helix domain-containing protein [Vicinamibacterales bacterium]